MTQNIIFQRLIEPVEAKVMLSEQCSTMKAFMDSEIRVIQAAETYMGEYTVIPSGVDQVLATNSKLMTDDVLVKEIPSYSVANEYGTTVVIG